MLRRFVSLCTLLLSIALVAYTGTTTLSVNQVVAHGDIVALVNNGQLLWAGTAPSWTSSDARDTTCSEFITYVKNNGETCATLYGNIPTTANNRAVVWSDAQTLRVLTTVHTPVLSNASFQLGNLQSWTVSNSCSTSYTFGVASAADTDADGYGAQMVASGSGGVSGCTVHFAQTVAVSGTPTSQSVSFWYEGTAPTGTGDAANCNVANASATAYVIVNGVTYSTTVANNGSWHAYTWNITSLINGNNTVTVYVTTAAAENQTSHFSTADQIYLCNSPTYSAATAYVDKISLTATY